MREFSASLQELPPGSRLVRFHAGPDGKYLDEYFGVCVVVVHSPLIIEVLGFIPDHRQDFSQEELERMIKAGEQEFVKLGYRYRFQERVRHGKLKGYLQKLGND